MPETRKQTKYVILLITSAKGSRSFPISLTKLKERAIIPSNKSLNSINKKIKTRQTIKTKDNSLISDERIKNIKKKGERNILETVRRLAKFINKKVYADAYLVKIIKFLYFQMIDINYENRTNPVKHKQINNHIRDISIFILNDSNNHYGYRLFDIAVIFPCFSHLSYNNMADFKSLKKFFCYRT